MASVGDFRYLVVPHTHWDREWYLPFEFFRLRLGSVVDGVLDTLERDPSFTSFTLDGQAIVLEDYVEVRPENEERLRALLAAGRLEAGPSYVLPDEILVGGEPLVRNLLLGRRVCRRFGIEPSGAGYMPDSFGHPAQLPQILAGFGIRTFLFSRGMGDEIADLGVVFRWRAGPAEVVACQMLPHYDNFARLTWFDDAEERLDAIVEHFGDVLCEAGQDTIVLANGSDHLPIEPELPTIVAGLAESVDAPIRIGRYDEYAPTADGLPVHEGELVGSRLQNVLRGVNSARVYLKQANERAERRVLSIETAAALRALRGEGPFPAADLRLAWRDVLRNHPHDSICGCSCDEVHRDMLVRWEQLDRTLEYVEREALGVGGALVNTLPFRRSRVVDGELVEVPGFGGQRPESGGNRPFLSLGDILRFEDEPDVGDLYTFCPGGKVRTADLVASRPTRGGLVLEHELPGIRIETTLRPGPGRVEVTSVVENEADDHRLRVLVRGGGGASHVRAESQFAVVQRPLGATPARGEWREPPVPTAHTLGAVALGPLVVLTKGIPEYEASEDGLRLTLLRCVGTISRPSGMPTRPNAAGPDIATPDGQCRGRHVFEYAIRSDGEELSNSALVRASQDYRTDFLRGDPFEPPLELGGDVVFSCLKGAEDGDGLVLRVFNPNPQPETITLNVPARRIRLDEEHDADRGLELAPGEIATFLLVRD
ncbi:MAG: 2-O-(6-phospho-alpha-D-mannosyl)-D-glycerate hydrolase [Gaiellaceae bacterium]|jgi:alpha-mannosidase|nr:2-O-(6-phospho-alpha-D-mannosyl)-D-glycerate hydrolase [Gaiellaceae bacterium]